MAPVAAGVTVASAVPTAAVDDVTPAAPAPLPAAVDESAVEETVVEPPVGPADVRGKRAEFRLGCMDSSGRRKWLIY